MSFTERVSIRLSKVYDYDLWCLCQTIGRVAFSQMIREILVCYATNTTYKIPTITIWDVPDSEKKERAKVLSIRVPSKYREQITPILENVPDGRKAIFIKTLARIYLTSILLEPFYAKIPERRSVTGQVAREQEMPKQTVPNQKTQTKKEKEKITIKNIDEKSEEQGNKCNAEEHDTTERQPEQRQESVEDDVNQKLVEKENSKTDVAENTKPMLPPQPPHEYQEPDNYYPPQEYDSESSYSNMDSYPNAEDESSEEDDDLSALFGGFTVN